MGVVAAIFTNRQERATGSKTRLAEGHTRELPEVRDSGGATTENVIEMTHGFRWAVAGNATYAASQWGVLVALAKLGTPELVGQFAFALALTSPLVLFSQLNLRAVQATDAKHEYEFAEYPDSSTNHDSLCPNPHWADLHVFQLSRQCGYRDRLGGTRQVFRFHNRHRLWELAASGTPQRCGGGQHCQWIDIFNRGRGCIVADEKRIRGGGSLCRWICDGSPHRCYCQPEGAASRVYKPRLVKGVVVDESGASAWSGDATGDAQRKHSTVLFVATESGDRDLGIFAAVSYFVVAGSTLVNALGQSVSPRLSREYASGRVEPFLSSLRLFVAFAVVLGVAGVAATVVAGEFLLRLMYRAGLR